MPLRFDSKMTSTKIRQERMKHAQNSLSPFYGQQALMSAYNPN